MSAVIAGSDSGAYDDFPAMVPKPRLDFLSAPLLAAVVGGVGALSSVLYAVAATNGTKVTPLNVAYFLKSIQEQSHPKAPPSAKTLSRRTNGNGWLESNCRLGGVPRTRI